MKDPKPGMAGHDCEPLGYLEEADYHEDLTNIERD